MFIIANTVIIFSCAEEEKENINAEAAGSKVEKEITGTSSGQGHDERTAGKSVLSVISDPEGRDFLLYNEKEEALIYPEDFQIGPLQGMLVADKTVIEIMKTAEDFLSSIVGDEPEYSLVIDARKDFIQRNVEYELEQAVPAGFRIGTVNTISEPARVPIRLEGPNGSAEGTMYFKNEGGWKIFDFHMDFSDLNKEKEPADDTWYPSEKLM